MFDIFDERDGALYQHKYDAHPDTGLFFRHIHGEVELHLFVGGDASFNIEGNLFKLSPYDLSLIPPQSFHCLILDGLSAYERFVFNFPIGKFGIDVGSVFEKTRIVNIADKPQILSVFDRMRLYAETMPRRDLSDAICLLLQECLLLIKNERNFPSTPHSHDALTGSIVKYINDNITEPLTIDGIAEHFCLSKSHVQNVFNDNMKIGIKSYILRKKMARAYELLKNGARPTIVADGLGFSNYVTFYKNFVNTYSVPPKSFIR